MTSSAPKRTHHQLQRDRQLIADWYSRGETQTAIAALINSGAHLVKDEDGVCVEPRYTLSQQTISNDIKAIQKAWLESSLRDFDEMRAEQLGKIDEQERRYHRGWERSCLDAETVVRKQKEGGGKEQQMTSKGQAGDPRFLAGVDGCIDRRCKLLGLDAPTKSIVEFAAVQKVAGFDNV